MASTSPTIPTSSRILNPALAQRVMSADEAAALIQPGSILGMSGFTGSGYPKAVPTALAKRIAAAHEKGESFKVSVFTGASTGPELDGALAKADGVNLRLPYSGDPEMRKRINGGETDYMDIHLSHVAQLVDYGFLGKMDVAIIEVTAILEDGRIVPSSSMGNNTTWINRADKVILEVNSAQPLELEGMHDIYYGLGLPPHRQPIPLLKSDQRIGTPYLKVPMEKVIAVVATDIGDRASPFKAPDEASKKIAGNIINFLEWEVKKGRMPSSLFPLQSGVGNIANAVLFGLEEAPFEGMTAYTEVIQDGMVQLLDKGKLCQPLGDGLLAQSRRHRQHHAEDRQLPQPDRHPPAGDLQQPGDHPPHRRDRDERHDRGRHLRQRKLHPHHGLEHAERHWRLGRLHPQRLSLVHDGALDCREGQHLHHRPHGLACGSHRA